MDEEDLTAAIMEFVSYGRISSEVASDIIRAVLALQEKEDDVWWQGYAAASDD